MNSTLLGKEPIGAVVKKADNLFTRIVRRTSQGDFNRIDWQLLNFLHEKDKVSKTEIIDFLTFFESKKNIENVITRFEKDGLVDFSGDEALITIKGNEAFKEAHAEQERIKERSLQDITEADYITTIETIKKMVENLTEFLPESATTDTTKHGQVSDCQTEDLKRIRTVVEKMQQAHNQKDPELIASLFAENAVFVNAAGVRLQGKDSIYKSAKSVMKSFLAKSYAKYQISEIRFLKVDIVIVDIDQHPTTITGELLPDETAGIPTYVLMKDSEGEWKIVSGQNTLVIKN